MMQCLPESTTKIGDLGDLGGIARMETADQMKMMLVNIRQHMFAQFTFCENRWIDCLIKTGFQYFSNEWHWIVDNGFVQIGLSPESIIPVGAAEMPKFGGSLQNVGILLVGGSLALANYLHYQNVAFWQNGIFAKCFRTRLFARIQCHSML